MKGSNATGRRKTAIASVRLLPGSGKFMINKQTIDEYFPIDIYRMNTLRPFEVTKTDGKFDVHVIVRGGGKSGQTGAIQLAIARALVSMDEEMRHALRDAGLLTRDPRMVERKKYGQKKARKRFQFSKR
jgi:small subunit ribosomal protein S9